MKPASRLRARSEQDRLMVLDVASRGLRTSRVGGLPDCLEAGDVCVVNDAATLPASLPVRIVRAGGEERQAELRVFGGDLGSSGAATFEALLFAGEPSRRPTEERQDPDVAVGDRLITPSGRLVGVVEQIRGGVGRHVSVARPEGDALLQALYREGRPIGYAYLEASPALWDVQTPFASRPWAGEMPSAGRPLSFSLVTALRRRGVEVVRITHGAGLSSSGRAEIDARLPRTETYEIDPIAAAAISGARRRGARVVAVGTSVVRALESVARSSGDVRPIHGDTDLVIGPGFVPRVVDDVLTGMHEPGTSHFALLEAFAPAELLEAACRRGDDEGFWLHEYGDSLLVRTPRPPAIRAA